LVTAADLLIYFGELTPFLRQARTALRPGGRLVMTLEALENSTLPYEIQPTGRFRHGEHYVDTLLNQLAFDQVDIIPETLRVEGGAPLACWLVTARRPN
jgi:predicted TPR repeat methyltransferase